MSEDAKSRNVAIEGLQSSNANSLVVPRASVGDKVYALVKGTLGAIPDTNGIVGELFGAFVRQPLEKRQEKFASDVIERLDDLAAQGKLKVEDVVDNPLFTTTLANATRHAAFTQQQEKLEALRNAVLNSCSPQRFDETRIMIYLALLEQYTALHLRIVLQAITNNRLRHLKGETKADMILEEADIQSERREMARALHVESLVGFNIVRPAMHQLGRDGLISNIPNDPRMDLAMMEILPSELGLDFWSFFSAPPPAAGSDQ